jgi:membrane-bound metal-dependent hydrolase YbcI (DUF457 family)
MLSHSVPAVFVLAILAAAVQFGRADLRAAWVVGAVVVSHVLLDYLTGIKPTWPGGPIIGLGIYRYPVVDFGAEAAVIVFGWLLYRRTLPPAARKWNPSTIMLAILLLMQIGADSARLLFPSINKC